METKINLQLPIIGKELLSKINSRQITIPEFDKECAYWMMGDISTMSYKDDVHKPDIIVNYEGERDRDPKYQVAPSFWSRPDVKDYMAQKRSLLSQNHANWHWLHFIKKHIPKEDMINHRKIAMAIASYPNHKDGYIPKDDWRNR